MTATKELYHLGIEPETQVCMNCKHFYRHYVSDVFEKNYVPILFGHCSFPRLKNRRVTDTCKHFQPKNAR